MIEISRGDTIGRVTATLSDGTANPALTGATAVSFQIYHLTRGLDATVSGSVDTTTTASFAVADVSSLAIGVYLPIAVVTFPTGTAQFPCEEFTIKSGYDGE